jgi:hypothetical protein
MNEYRGAKTNFMLGAKLWMKMKGQVLVMLPLPMKPASANPAKCSHVVDTSA